jgi:hypothetical protein
MTIPPLDGWVVSRLLCGQPLNGELHTLSEPFRRLAIHLDALAPGDRQNAFGGFLKGLSEPEETHLVSELAKIDPLGPAPQVQASTFATAADIRRIMASVRWLWDGWIPASRVVGLAALEGVGKTRVAMDLCRRVYLNLPWPDGQTMTLPKGAPSLWLCADGQHDEIADILPSFGLPDEAAIFPAPPNDPYDNTSLDDDDTLAQVDAAISTCKPWAVVIDTLTYATSHNLCEQRSVAFLKKPLVDLVQRHQINLLLLLHVSMDGQALGKRIKGITRTLLHLECPEPGKPGRLRFWVEKSYGKKPPALGVTMHDAGNDYDFDAPDRRNRAREADHQRRETRPSSSSAMPWRVRTTRSAMSSARSGRRREGSPTRFGEQLVTWTGPRSPPTEGRGLDDRSSCISSTPRLPRPPPTRKPRSELTAKPQNL